MKYVFCTSPTPSEKAKELAKTLGKEALNKEIEIKYSKNGKPYFEGNERYISISHSKENVLVGINEKPIGVDIEVIRPFEKKLIKRYFTTEEVEFIDTEEKFFLVWTVKEAFLKLTGEGLKGIKKLNVITNGKFYIDGYLILSFIKDGCAFAIVYEK